MIIIRMSGGLGNQMFALALYVKLISLKRNVYIDDFSEYVNQEKTGVRRPLLLKEAFGIKYAQKTRMEAHAGITRVKLQPVFETDGRFNPAFLQSKAGYFCGYYQSARYFEGVEDEICRIFTFREEIYQEDEKTAAYAEQIRACEEPVSLHLRFGDYLDKPETYGGICTDDYYEAAIRRILRKTDGKDVCFFIFSNDREKAQAWIEDRREKGVFGAAKVCLTDANSEDTGYRDMALMTLCRHHVLANSSFSWWAAYLAGRRYGEESIRIAPSCWMYSEDRGLPLFSDIYTDDLYRITAQGIGAGTVGRPEISAEEPEKAPLVSVIVAAYNVETYVRRAMDSLLAQTYRKLEIIAVDDGSTDGTGRILDEYGEKDSRVRVVHKENGGLSDCRNAGLKIASGEYIGYLDGDDRAKPEMIEAMLLGCLLADAGVSVIRYEQVPETEIAADVPAETGKTGTVSDEDRLAGIRKTMLVFGQDKALEKYLICDGEIIIYNSVWSKLFRRDTVEGREFPKGRNSEDILYTTGAMLRMRHLAYIHTPLYEYTTGRSGSIMSAKAAERRFNDEIPFWKDQIRLLSEAGKEELSEKAAYAFYRRMLYYDLEFRKQGMKEEAARLEKMMRDESLQIRSVYSNFFVQLGDRKRMKMFLKSPDRYEQWSDRYEKYVVPLKQKLRKRG